MKIQQLSEIPACICHKSNLVMILSVTWLLFLGYDFILSEANLSYEAKPSAINLPNLNINSYPKNMSPCNDFITYFFVDKMNIFTRLSLPIRYGILQRE